MRVTEQLIDVFAEHIDADDTRAVRDELLEIVAKRFGTPNLPSEHETVVIPAVGLAKTAALLADRVWSTPGVVNPPPADILAYGATDVEVTFQLLALIESRYPKIGETIRETLAEQLAARGWRGEKFNLLTLMDALWSAHRVVAIPVLPGSEGLAETYQPGDRSVIIASFKRLAVVDETKLTWEQVAQFRCDSEARAAYRALLHWLDREMVGRSGAFIADEIARRHEAYLWALRKHGIETVLGAFERVIAGDFLVGSAALSTAAGYFGGIDAAVATIAATSLATVGISMTRSLVTRHEVHRDGADVAFVHHLARHFPKAG